MLISLPKSFLLYYKIYKVVHWDTLRRELQYSTGDAKKPFVTDLRKPPSQLVPQRHSHRPTGTSTNYWRCVQGRNDSSEGPVPQTMGTYSTRPQLQSSCAACTLKKALGRVAQPVRPSGRHFVNLEVCTGVGEPRVPRLHTQCLALVLCKTVCEVSELFADQFYNLDAVAHTQTTHPHLAAQAPVAIAPTSHVGTAAEEVREHLTSEPRGGELSQWALQYPYCRHL